MRLYHYTKGDHIESLIRDGVIALSTMYVPEHEKPVVWCSTNPVWEGTVSAVDGSMGELARRHGGAYRIKIEPSAAPLRWKEAVNACGIDRDTAKALGKSAKAHHASVSDWRASMTPIPSAAWLAIEKWDGTKWVDAGIWDVANRQPLPADTSAESKDVFRIGAQGFPLHSVDELDDDQFRGLVASAEVILAVSRSNHADVQVLRGGELLQSIVGAVEAKQCAIIAFGIAPSDPSGKLRKLREDIDHLCGRDTQ